MGKLRPDAGFSLIELVVVVSITAVVMAMLVPGIRAASDAFQLRKAAGIAVAELRTAQARATANGLNVMFEFYTSTGAGDPGGVRAWASSGGPWYELRHVLPPDWPASIQLREGAGLAGCTAPADPAHRCLTFRPLGYVDNAGDVKIQVRSGTPQWTIAVNAATGRTTVTR